MWPEYWGMWGVVQKFRNIYGRCFNKPAHARTSNGMGWNIDNEFEYLLYSGLAYDLKPKLIHFVFDMALNSSVAVHGMTTAAMFVNEAVSGGKPPGGCE